MIDYGCLQTPSDQPLPERLLFIHQGSQRAHRRAPTGLGRSGAAVLQRNVQTAFAVGQARGVDPARRGPARGAGPRVRPARGQGGGDRLRSRPEGPGPTDGPGGPGHDRAAPSGRCRRRAGGRHLRGPQPPAGGLTVIASLTGRVASVRPDSAVIVVGGVGYRVFAGPAHAREPAASGRRPACTRTTSCGRTSRRCTASGREEELGFFELLITVTGVGPKVGLAIVVLAAGGGPPAGHPAGRRGGAHGGQRRRQAAGRADRARAQGEGRRRRRRERWGRRPAGAPSRRWWARSRRWATRPRNPREAARLAVAGMAPGAIAWRNGSRPRSGRCAANDPGGTVRLVERPFYSRARFC